MVSRGENESEVPSSFKKSGASFRSGLAGNVLSPNFSVVPKDFISAVAGDFELPKARAIKSLI